MPLNTLENRPNNLPTQPTPLIGREAERTAIQALLYSPNTPTGARLLTLTGPGGIGKSRLALQIAADLLPHFSDGVYFIPLASHREPQQILQAIAQSLGINEPSDIPLIEHLKTTLHAKETLLVLDNFEQVLDAAPALADLLGAAPSLTILVTSRIVLKLYGEQEYNVPPLTLPDLTHRPTPDRLTQYEAVQLFIARALAVNPEFSVTNENAPALAQICIRLDGLPLAIELAAARTKLFTPQALLTRLDNRLQLLVGGARDLPTRQQTLRATLDWSYALLEPAEQQRFARLGVFVGGATLEAVGAICGDTGLEELTSLIDKSLLRPHPGPDGQPRFMMLETIQEYALERLTASGQAPLIRQHHLDYYLAYATAAEPHLLGPDSPAWLDRLDPDTPNIHAALAWALEGGAIEIGLRLAVAWSWYWSSRSRHQEGAAWFDRLLARPEASSPTPFRAKALYHAGHFHRRLGNFTLMRTYHEEGAAIARALNDPRLLADALSSLGIIAEHQGHPDKAQTYYQESINLYHHLGDTERAARGSLGLGSLAQNQGHYDQAQHHFQEALTLYRQLKHTWGISFGLNALGYVTYLQGDDATAWETLQESLTLSHQIGGLDADTLAKLGAIAHYRGHYDQARDLYTQSLARFRAGNWNQFIPGLLQDLGHIACHQGHYSEAITLFQESLSHARRLDKPTTIAAGIAGIACVAAALAQPYYAACLLAVAHRERQSTSTPLDPATQRDYDHALTQIHAHLTAEEFTAAWTQGHHLPLPQALVEAMRLSSTDIPPDFSTSKTLAAQFPPAKM